MVNEEKVRIMTKIAMSEEKSKHKDTKAPYMYKSDYVYLNVLSVIGHVSIAYFLIIALIAMYNLDYILVNIVSMDYIKIAFEILMPYLFIIMLLSIISFIHYRGKYDDCIRENREYFHELKELEKFYADSRKEQTNVTTTDN